MIINCNGYIPIKKILKIKHNDKIIISDSLKSNKWVFEDIKRFSQKRNKSLLIGGLITIVGGSLSLLADKQYNSYQKTGSNADQIRTKLEMTDGISSLSFALGSSILIGSPAYYHYKIKLLKDRYLHDS